MASEPTQGRVVASTLSAILLVGLLIFAILETAGNETSLAPLVAADIEATGLENPVTAVLLDFRAYDTLLELVVMLVALLGAWSLGTTIPALAPRANPVFDLAVRLVVPIAILFAGYLLWIGATAPGGAFQAGAVLAGAGVLVAALRPGPIFAESQPWLYRLMIVPGILAFILIGGIVAFLDDDPGLGAFLNYPDASAKWLILGIEAAAMIGIAVTLIALFKGGRPHDRAG